MWMRSAFWIGAPKVGREQEFHALISNELVPEMRHLPGVSDVHALWPKQREDEPPAIHCQVIVRFESKVDLATMMASNERAMLRPRVLEAVAMFEGSLSHIDYEAS